MLHRRLYADNPEPLIIRILATMFGKNIAWWQIVDVVFPTTDVSRENYDLTLPLGKEKRD